MKQSFLHHIDPFHWQGHQFEGDPSPRQIDWCLKTNLALNRATCSNSSCMMNTVEIYCINILINDQLYDFNTFNVMLHWKGMILTHYKRHHFRSHICVPVYMYWLIAVHQSNTSKYPLKKKKNENLLSYKVNIMVANELVTKGAKTLAGMVLT